MMWGKCSSSWQCESDHAARMASAVCCFRTNAPSMEIRAHIFGSMREAIDMSGEKKVMAEQLAEFVIELRFQNLSGKVIELAKMAVLDQLGCQLIGSTLEWNKIPFHFVRDLE